MTMKDTKSEEMKLHRYCLRCGRRLISLENRQRGMGQVCWEKSQVEQGKKHLLF